MTYFTRQHIIQKKKKQALHDTNRHGRFYTAAYSKEKKTSTCSTYQHGSVSNQNQQLHIHLLASLNQTLSKKTD
jgi:ABC-type uncharacterized transport system substrate-binding protein